MSLTAPTHCFSYTVAGEMVLPNYCPNSLVIRHGKNKWDTWNKTIQESSHQTEGKSLIYSRALCMHAIHIRATWTTESMISYRTDQEQATWIAAGTKLRLFPRQISLELSSTETRINSISSSCLFSDKTTLHHCKAFIWKGLLSFNSYPCILFDNLIGSLQLLLMIPLATQTKKESGIVTLPT